MDKNELIAIVLLLAVSLGAGIAVFGANQIYLSSYDYELKALNGGHWSYSEMRVPVGKEVTILLRNTDVVSHGFVIPDFNVGVQELKAGEVVEVKFTPDKKGEFPFLCSVWCSDRHLQMRGILIVE